MPRGKKLRILLTEPAMVHWSTDGWQNSHDVDTEETGWNLQHVDLSTETLPSGRQIIFTFNWKNGARWEGRDYQVTIE
jgi:glucoamylase